MRGPGRVVRGETKKKKRKKEKLNSLGRSYVSVQHLCVVNKQRGKCPLRELEPVTETI